MKNLAQLKQNKWAINTLQMIAMFTTATLLAQPLIASDGTIWTTGISTSSNFWTNLQNLYINGLFLPLIGVSLLGWAIFAKDEKARARFMSAVKIEIIVFIVLQLPDIAVATFNQFAGWLNGNA